MHEKKIVLTVTTDATDMELARIAGQIAASAAEDYGEDAWGGYDGPTLTDIVVSIEIG